MNGVDAFMAGLALRSRAAENPNDFRRNGLLYCGYCGMAKECRIDLDGEIMTVGCMCQCTEEAYQAERKEVQARERVLRIADLRVQGIQDRAMRGYTFQAADPEINRENMAKCRRYADRWDEMRKENLGLMLAGPPGTGKTYAAACVANALLSRGVPVLVTSFPKILNTGGWDKAELVGQMKEFELLVIDDLGTERKDRGGGAGGYALEIVQMVIDERYKTGKPLIVTTNLSKSQMDSPENMDYRRIFDRLEELCVPIYFGGPSLRKSEGERKRQLAREVFG